MESIQQFKQLVERHIQRPGIEDLMDWLEGETDFFTSPASTRFHGSYEGGLCEHSLNVYDQLVFELDTLVGHEWDEIYSQEAVAIVALFHDLCKIGRYTTEVRWRKDDDGQWESYETYAYDKEKTEMGHGPQSVFYIQQFMRLTEQEAQAIFWHMGAYDISPYANLNGLSSAFGKNPLAFLIHRADMASTYVIENENFEYGGTAEPATEEEVIEVEEVVEEKPAKKAKPAKKEKAEVAEEKPAKGSSSIRVPRPVKKEEPEEEVVEEVIEEAVEEPEAEVADVTTYWYNAEHDMYYLLEAGEALPLDDEELAEDEYMDIMFPLLEEDFYYLLPDDTAGVIKAGERLPEDYDEETYNPITKEDYLERTKPKEKPTVVAKASRKTPSPSRRPRP